MVNTESVSSRQWIVDSLLLYYVESSVIVDEKLGDILRTNKCQYQSLRSGDSRPCLVRIPFDCEAKSMLFVQLRVAFCVVPLAKMSSLVTNSTLDGTYVAETHSVRVLMRTQSLSQSRCESSYQ